jgi:hypothetical protein
MTMALFECYRRECNQCGVSRDTIKNIDIDAASFGIIECSGYYRSWHFHFVPVDNS